MSYRRHAFVGQVGGEAIRLTLDRDVRAAARDSYAVPFFLDNEGASLTEGRVLEIKFERELPAALNDLLENLGLLPASFSKYRTAMGKVYPRPPPDGGRG